MSFIKTTDILIRNKNKLYLQVNYNLDDVVKIKEVGIIIDGTLYLSNYFTLNYSVFDLSFLKEDIKDIIEEAKPVENDENHENNDL